MPRILGTSVSAGHSPLLKVSVATGKGKQLAQQVTATIDSGADRTVVPRSLVEALGVNYDNLQGPVDAAGDAITGMGADGNFELRECKGKVRWHTTVICNEFWVANCAVVLLGRDDFFKLFDVMFDWSAPTPYVDIESAGTMRARAAAAT